MALLIRADGTERDVDGRLSLEAVQFLIGGYVQRVTLPDGRYMLMDEDGKSHRKTVNQKATMLWWPQHDHVVGDVLVLTAEEYDHLTPVRPFTKREG